MIMRNQTGDTVVRRRRAQSTAVMRLPSDPEATACTPWHRTTRRKRMPSGTAHMDLRHRRLRRASMAAEHRRRRRILARVYAMQTKDQTT